ncbi:MAG TPA: RNA polymerase sigma-70 factor [Flavisolibacter sp.]|nr:RNA polymerase sigma-70 factor [Flavisolibacter sp.]
MTKDQFESCFRTYYKQLVVFAYKMVHRQDVAEDMVQQVFMSAWEHLEQLEVDKGILSYLYQSTRNRCLNHLNSAHQTSTMHVEDPVSDHLVAIDRRVETKELLLQIKAAIQELPEKCREVFLLSREQGLTYKEIAATLDISVKTVENQMGKALKHLYSRIGSNLEAILIIFFLTR